MRNERALLLFHPGLDFLQGFFGCLHAGVIAVPSFPPHPARLERTLPRLLAISRSSRPSVVLCDAATAKVAQALPEELSRLPWIVVEEIETARADSWADPGVGLEDIAFLQYTSGSTATPKGVMVSHGNLLANLDSMRQAFDLSPDDVSVTWLPAFHDMGLIEGLLEPLFAGCPAYLMSPAEFTQRPLLWLEAISRFRGTHSGAPNFAYDLCSRKMEGGRDPGPLDLSSWRTAYNGAEPVRAQTLERFAAAFAPYGFRPASLDPVYGLAEATLMATGSVVDHGPVTGTFSADALKQRVARAAREGEESMVLASSGRVCPGFRLAIVDPESGERCPPGGIGEIWLHGPSIAQGYWEMPEESERTFRARLTDPDDGPFLRTGDLGFFQGENLFVAGRIKDVIIIRGANHYPQDIELTVERCHPALRPGCGAAFSIEAGGEERLVVVQEVDRTHRGEVDLGEIAVAARAAVAAEHELELHALSLLETGSVAKTSSGKIQRSASRRSFLEGTLRTVGEWRAPVPTRAEGGGPAVARPAVGAKAVRTWLIDRMAHRLGVPPAAIDPGEPFARYGIDSAAVTALTGELEEWLGADLSATLLYEHPSVAAVAAFLAGESREEASAVAPAAAHEPVAVVGIGCRFPGAEGPRAFWSLLREGVDAVTEVPPSRWDLSSLYDPDPAAPGKMNSRWGGFLERIDELDAPLFGISPREAERMDPQQRLLLEVAWETLEDAGVAPERLRGSAAGVFVGISGAEYARLQLGDLATVDAYGGTGNALSIAANRLSYFFDFHGPSLAVDTACSSSLVALHLACRSLAEGECSLALAGGVNLILDPAITVVFSKAGLLAPDGRCKSFDSRADGYVRSEGCGLVLLKPLSRALADGDRIYAVVRGSAVNQDGRSNGLTAPNPQAQEAVLREAYRRAGLPAHRVGYVETHGSGTALGDPIEASALGAVLGEGRPAGESCAIGTVKTNLGHLEAAAGIAGLIKVALALHHGEIPPSLHFREPNPRIRFDGGPLRVQRELASWPRGAQPALAGVSSFGFGGTNAHVVLEQAPEPAPAAPATRSAEVLLLSARTAGALDAMTGRLATCLREQPPAEISLADVASTLLAGRRRFDHRRMVLAHSLADACEALAGNDPDRVLSHVAGRGEPRVVFVLPGLGDHYPGMAAGLYREEPVFRAEVDRCAEILAPHLGVDLREALFGGGGDAPATGRLDLRRLLGRGPQATAGRLDETALAQPAVFVIDYALARLWMHWGVRPDALIGYSLGEYVAACLADVFSLENALTLVAERARLLQELPAGGMLAVALPEEEALAVAEGLSVAAVNGPSTCLLAGPTAAVEEAERRLAGRRVAFRRLRTSHAFHSPMMEPAREALVARAGAAAARAPRIPYLSNVTGGWIEAAQATDPRYWGEHLCGAVRFGDGIAELLRQPENVFLEVGPGQGLAALLRMHPDFTAERIAVSSLRPEHSGQSDTTALLTAAGKLWLAGVEIDAGAFHPTPRRRVPLPTYPFERQSYWLEGTRPATAAGAPRTAARRRDPADWFYAPVWEPAPAADSLPAGGTWLVFLDPSGLGEELLRRLREGGRTAVGVLPGDAFARREDALYTIDPERGDSYDALLGALREAGALPDRVVHLWGVTGPAAEPTLEDCLRLGFSSLLALAQALVRARPSHPVEVTAVTDGAQAVTGGEAALFPAKATVPGLCRVLSQEEPGLRCRAVDLDPGELDPAAQAGRLLAELALPGGGGPAVWRGGERRTEGFAPLHLEPGAPGLRPRGVYLVTGGLGAVGLTLADALAQAVAARLVLTGRSGLPARGEWEALLSTHAPDHPLSRRIHAVRALEAAGAEVLVLAADAADPRAMRAVVEQARERFGRLDGVVHAAGILTLDAFRPAAEATRDDVEIHFRPKVRGLLALEEALRGQDLDFCLLVSSISSVLGGRGLAAYAAANTFLDAFAASRRDGRRWLSVAWDAWEGSGEHAGMAGVAEYAMSPAEGADAFLRVLASGRSGWLAHSTADLAERRARWTAPPAEERAAAPERTAQPRHARPALQSAYVPARSELERRIAALWQQVLGIRQVGLHDNFFDLGGNSLIGVQLVADLRRELGVEVSNVVLFEAPTVAALARRLDPESGAAPSVEVAASAPATARSGREIAVIGMAGRFPGAPDVATLWDKLVGGEETISFFTDEELLAAGIDATEIAAPSYVKARPVLGDVEGFDAQFFGYSPREASLMDPQHRIFMECSWQALEDAGHDPRQDDRPVGLFAGCGLSTYLLSLYADPQVAASLDLFSMVVGNDKDSMPTAVSYKLDLKGPSVAVQTHCSTSLVAVHMACQSLLAGECDMALAGGVSVRVPQIIGYQFQEGGQGSPDGHCRSFDAEAAGTVFGDGVAVVVLKRLADALADGDTIHAVIKGTAVNNDGSLKIGYTAPSVEGQSLVVRQALANAGVPAETIGYVEGHGSATRLGDPIEVSALSRAFRAGTERTGFCGLGSAKSNVGHLDRASGATGLIKTVLSLEHKTLPGTLHFRSPNPEVDLAASPFFVTAETRPWPAPPGGAPRRAGVNSLGMGGTNAHVILEEAPALPPSDPPARRWQLLPLSARTASALEAASENLAACLERQPAVELADVAFTLQLGRRPFEHRRAVLADSPAAAAAALRSLDPRRVFTGFHPPGERPVAFLFPGLGDHYVGMARDLYQGERGFRERVDRCCEILRPLLGVDLRTVLYPEEGAATADRAEGLDLRRLLGRTRDEGAAGRDPLGRTALSQPAVFVIDWALAGFWMDLGVRPWALLGYSLGEYVAACLSGVLSLEDALALVARRAQLIQEMPPGAMLAVPLAEREMRPLLSGRLALAAVNGPAVSVVSGPVEEVEALERRLADRGLSCQRLQATHAFHSSMLEPVRDGLTELASRFELRPPQIPFLSNVTGRWITDEQATDPGYWAAHMCETVRFEDGLRELLGSGSALLEVGPGQALTSAALQRRGDEDGGEQAAPRVALPSLRHRYDTQPDTAFLLGTLSKLWLAGVGFDWRALHGGERRRRLPLPTYPFEHQRYWVDAARRPAAPAELPIHKRSDLGSWLYVPGWRRLPLAATGDRPSLLGAPWLVFSDARGVGEILAARLRDAGARVVEVRPGEAFLRSGESSYTVDPASPGDYEELLKHLRVSGWPPVDVAHLWSLDAPGTSSAQAEGALEAGFYSLLFLAQALGNQGYTHPLRLHLATANACDVTGGDLLHPLSATLLGPCKVIPQEYPNVSCRLIDLDLAAGRDPRDAAEEALAEMTAAARAERVAYRGRYRWVEEYEPAPLPPVPSRPARLRERGVYLITGGLGGLGLAMARHLARTVAARLVLVSRTPLPPRQEWDAWRGRNGTDAPVSRRIARVEELEALGAEVLVAAADVADAGRMAEVVAETRERFGALHGVLHTAGVPGDGLIQRKERVKAAAVLAPKVAGTLVLAELVEPERPDFFVLFSSTSSLTGGPGEVDYCAANAFLDAFAHGAGRQPSPFTVAVNWGPWEWDAWQDSLLQALPELREQLRRIRLELGITFEEGGEALDRILDGGHRQVAVLTQGLEALLAQARTLTTTSFLDTLEKARSARPRFGRPNLSTHFVAPANEMESRLAEVFQDLLGIDQVGVHDAFFDLGGNSLVGLQVVARAQKELQARLSVADLFAAPTVRSLAALIARPEEETPALDLSSDRGRLRRQQRRGRRETAALPQTNELELQ